MLWVVERKKKHKKTHCPSRWDNLSNWDSIEKSFILSASSGFRTRQDPTPVGSQGFRARQIQHRIFLSALDSVRASSVQSAAFIPDRFKKDTYKTNWKKERKVKEELQVNYKKKRKLKKKKNKKKKNRISPESPILPYKLLAINLCTDVIVLCNSFLILEFHTLFIGRLVDKHVTRPKIDNLIS